MIAAYIEELTSALLAMITPIVTSYPESPSGQVGRSIGMRSFGRSRMIFSKRSRGPIPYFRRFLIQLNSFVSDRIKAVLAWT
ncbi:MAG TPA: hypothetical protein VJB59_01835 [Bdellovibrionota bacterium]|nr:hypothetical protein [Bdellovibrionota bacterium]